MKTMLKRMAFFMILILIMTTAISGCSCQRIPNTPNDAPNDVPIVDNTPSAEEDSSLSTLVGKFTDRSINSAEEAILAVNDVKEDLGLASAIEELTVLSTNSIDNTTYYRLQQNYNGIPVYGSNVVVIADENGEAKGLTGNAVDIEALDITPTADHESIKANITNHLDSFVIVPELTDNDLTIFINSETSSATLAYSTTVFTNNEMYSVIVDAKSGNVLQSHPLTYTSSIKTLTIEDMLHDRVDVYDANGNLFCKYCTIIDGVPYLKGIDDCLYDFNGNKTYIMNRTDKKIYDLSNNVVNYIQAYNAELLYTIQKVDENTIIYYGTNDILMSEPAGVLNNEKASELVEQLANSHMFFASILNRNGYDDKDGDIIAVIEDFVYNKNAYSSPWGDKTIICIGTNKEITADLVAHEYMHSVEQSICGMIYMGESGAIMEGYSDIFGEIVEDWQNDGLDNDCDWKHGSRNIKSPLLVFRPWKYKQSSFWQNTSDLSKDNGGVHHNSTVISHAAYKMTQGANKLSTTQLAKLWYHTLYLLPPNCDFVNLRACMEIVAQTNTSIGLTEKQQAKVSAAFEKADIVPKEEKVNNNFNLYVLVEDDIPYGNCTIKIEGTETDGKNKAYEVAYSSMSSNPLPVYLNNGKYTITITNNSEGDTWVRQIKVNKRYSDNSVHIYTSFDEENIYIQGLEFTSNGDGTCYVSGIGSCTDTNLRIPPTSPEGDNVIRIENNAFSNCAILSSVVIPYGVTSIGERAFSDCFNLRSVIIPDSVNFIASCAFDSCSSLTSVEIPVSVTQIGVQAFAYCYSLNSINVSASNKSYKSIDGNLYAYDGKTLIQYAIGKTDSKFTLPDSVINIEDWAFVSCSHLRSVKIPYGVTTIGDHAFKWCSSLTSIEIPDSVTSIGDATFFLCDSLTSVVIGNSVTSIGDYAFDSCSSLTSVVIPDSVTSIDDYAFYGCNNLTEVYYTGSKDSWENISIGGGNEDLTEATIHYNYNSNDESTSYSEGLDFTSNGDGTCYVSGIGSCTDTDIVIPKTSTDGDRVTSIGDEAFYDCDSLNSVVIPDSVTSIGEYAFYH